MLKYIVSFVVLFSFVACNNDKNDQDQTQIPLENNVVLTDAQLKNAEIETGKISLQNISSLLKVNGYIDVPPQNMVSISVPLGGYLKATTLLPGMHIKKGEKIALIEDQQYITLQQEYLTEKAKLAYAKAEFFRQEELNKSKATSDKVFQLAKAEYITNKVLVKALGEKLKLIGINPDELTENSLSRNINIVSPIDGYVSKVNVNIGKYATPSDVIFELVNPTDIHLSLNIFEKDIDKLFIGQKLLAYTNNHTEKKYPCEIILIGKDLTKERSVVVHCHFEEYDKTLIPGMFMNAELDVQTNKAYVIHSDAIVRFEGKQYVFEQTGKAKFDLLEVSTQNNKDGFTQIVFQDTTNMSEKTFVTKGAYTLLMKMKNTEEEE